MGLKEQINEDIKSAMRAKEREKLEALRAVKAAIIVAETEKAGVVLDEAAGAKIIQKLFKQRKDAAALYVEQGRQDLADVELAQASVIEAYLPKQLTTEELETAVQAIIASTGATSMKDMGKVMGIASKQLAGKADGSVISKIVKQLLA